MKEKTVQNWGKRPRTHLFGLQIQNNFLKNSEISFFLYLLMEEKYVFFSRKDSNTSFLDLPWKIGEQSL